MGKVNVTNEKWGFLRESVADAHKAGIDADTGLHRTGLEEYLAIIFPDVQDWIHDKSLGNVGGNKYMNRPDYRSETLKLIVEFDGIHHYTNPDIILRDEKNTKLYMKLGYKVVRIPYFIQLTNDVVKELFNVDVQEALFNPSIPSLNKKGRNTPAYLCSAGVERMKREFQQFPEQYKVNKEYLKQQNDTFLTGVNLI